MLSFLHKKIFSLKKFYTKNFSLHIFRLNFIPCIVFFILFFSILYFFYEQQKKEYSIEYLHDLSNVAQIYIKDFFDQTEFMLQQFSNSSMVQEKDITAIQNFYENTNIEFFQKALKIGFFELNEDMSLKVSLISKNVDPENFQLNHKIPYLSNYEEYFLDVLHYGMQRKMDIQFFHSFLDYNGDEILFITEIYDQTGKVTGVLVLFYSFIQFQTLMDHLFLYLKNTNLMLLDVKGNILWNSNKTYLEIENFFKTNPYFASLLNISYQENFHSTANEENISYNQNTLLGHFHNLYVYPKWTSYIFVNVKNYYSSLFSINCFCMILFIVFLWFMVFLYIQIDKNGYYWKYYYINLQNLIQKNKIFYKTDFLEKDKEELTLYKNYIEFSFKVSNIFFYLDRFKKGIYPFLKKDIDILKQYVPHLEDAAYYLQKEDMFFDEKTNEWKDVSKQLEYFQKEMQKEFQKFIKNIFFFYKKINFFYKKTHNYSLKKELLLNELVSMNKTKRAMDIQIYHLKEQIKNLDQKLKKFVKLIQITKNSIFKIDILLLNYVIKATHKEQRESMFFSNLMEIEELIKENKTILMSIQSYLNNILLEMEKLLKNFPEKENDLFQTEKLSLLLKDEKYLLIIKSFSEYEKHLFQQIKEYNSAFGEIKKQILQMRNKYNENL